MKEAQAIMKGFKRNFQKKMAPQLQSDNIMADFSKKVEDVYEALGDAI